MSCHDIGKGLNSVAKIVIAQYQAGNLNKEACAAILHSCRKGVNWCDGNEHEAMQALVDAGICGCCLEETHDVSNVFDNELDVKHRYEVYRGYDKTAAHYYVCAACKKKILEQYVSDHPGVKLAKTDLHKKVTALCGV